MLEEKLSRARRRAARDRRRRAVRKMLAYQCDPARDLTPEAKASTQAYIERYARKGIDTRVPCSCVVCKGHGMEESVRPSVRRRLVPVELEVGV